MHSQAFVNGLILDSGYTKTKELLSYFAGVLLLTLLAQIAIPLPWTPVPVTGQTFGVALISLLWGRQRAFTIVASYLMLGVFGAPILAVAGAASYGYLFGMLFSTIVVGHLSDIGWTKSLLRNYLAGALGSLIVFTCGLAYLSFFLPSSELLMAGLIPFLPGDFVKTMTAAAIAHKLNKSRN